MKTSSANAKPESPSVQTARGCVATNVALPGFGSLMAKRRVGWAQAALTVLGFGFTLVFGARFVLWVSRNLSTLYGETADPFTALLNIWLNVRWAFAGMGMFAVSWLWTAVTNAAILKSAKSTGEKPKPPVLK